jgi:histidyl-tRNA synthetase
VHGLAGRRGNPAEVLDRLGHDVEAKAPDSVAALRALVGTLEHFGVDLDRVELDLGFGRGIGFYSRMIFELIAPTPTGPVEVCGGGRYDGLARVLGSARDDRGVGFAFGLERLRQVLDAQGRPGRDGGARGFLVVAHDPSSMPYAIQVATRLRAECARAVLEADRPFARAVARAHELGLARIIVVKGPPEDADAVALHDLDGTTEAEVPLAEVDRLVREGAGGLRE